jgi:hypothetical protein
MAFMEHEIVFGQWYNVDTENGTEYIPYDVVGEIEIDEDGIPVDNSLESYIEGRSILSVEKIEGYGARLSVAGYMDCTEWCVFDTEEEAEEFLEQMYGDDCDDEENDE